MEVVFEEINTQEEAEQAVTEFLNSLVDPAIVGGNFPLKQLLHPKNHLIIYTLGALVRESAMRNIELLISGIQH